MENPRYAPCKILLRESIPTLIWFEDAVRRYGVPTMTFDLYLIVPDIQHAADVLHRSGWRPKPPSRYSFLVPPCPIQYSRLVRPAPEDERNRNQGDACDSSSLEAETSVPLFEHNGTVLLSATEWKISTEELHEASNNYHFPPLSTLVNRLVTNWLDAPVGSQLALRLGLMLGYLYEYTSEVKTEEFKQCLELEHRQFHLDCLSGQLFMWTLPFARHERQIRENIRQGRHEFRECSVTRTKENKLLFTDTFDELAKRRCPYDYPSDVAKASMELDDDSEEDDD
ncbi:hypothetical protein F4777DRAFT_232886 [Nemania sp. FL0916]|nr:hypothetical protein F4777DRAFT_232886 [Nemania sp. FL0916]